MYNSHMNYNVNPVYDIKMFHEKFNRPSRELGAPLDPELLKFRIRFLAEELKEINKAAAEADLVEVLDGLVDLVYVAVGTAHQLNLDFNGAWERVQAANMAKVPVSSENPGKRGHATDIVKPPGWTPPCHKDLFNEADLNQKPLSTEEYGLVNLALYFTV